MNSSIQKLANLLTHHTEGIAIGEIEWHPAGKWSIAEILEHLSLTYTGTKTMFERCLHAGKPSATLPTFKDRLRAFVVTKLHYMPGGREAPAGTRPKGARSASLISDVARNLAAMDEVISECERRFGRKVKLVNHPILGPLTAREWRTFHCVHGRHHLRQVHRLRKLQGRR